MLTHHQVEHFRTFGFVVLRKLLSADEAAGLRHEVVTNLREAFGGLGTDTDPDDSGGIRGDYLPLSVDRAPLSQSLIADDARLFHGSAELVGRPTVPTVPIAVCFTTNAGWHTDDGTGIGGVKFLIHLDRRDAESGALRVIPGSHGPEFGPALERYLACDPSRSGFDGDPLPDVVLPTEPGDVIAFDVHLFHASAGGSRRLAWTIEYLPWPGLGDASRLAAVRDAVVDIVDYDHEGYDRDRWPTWREWVAGRPQSPSRQTAIERLRLLGVLGDGDPR